MHQAERHARILNYLEKNAFLSLSDAIEMLNTTRSTTSRDFSTLASRNLVERTRGGIRKSSGGLPPVLPFDQRRITQASEKDAIARRAVQLLQNADVVLADGGSTIFHVAAHLPDTPLTIVTVSIPLLNALSQRRRELQMLEVIVIGGVYNPDLGVSLGHSAQENISRIHAQWTFLGVDGVTHEGVSNNSYLSIQSKVQMIRNSEKVAVLADHTKIGRHAMTRICALDEIDILITDENEDTDPVLDKIREAGVEVVTVPVEAFTVKDPDPRA